MGLRIEFYEDQSEGRTLIYEPLTTNFYDSDTLLEELIWCKDLQGKGDENYLFGTLFCETLQEILDKHGEQIKSEMTKEDYKELSTLVNYKEGYLVVKAVW